MNTEILPVNDESIRLAGRFIREGQIIGIPTETVYGLGADALNEQAVMKIFAAKGRPADNPLIVHVSCEEEINPLVTEIPETARLLMKRFWPGPMTLVLPKAHCIPDVVSAGLDTVGIRMPESAAARAIIRESRRPIAAPSANTSGRPSPTTAMHVYEDLHGKIPLIIDDGPCRVGVESTVIDARGEIPVILRPGGITAEMIMQAVGSVRIDEHVMQPVAEGEAVRSPGMKYKHYAPKAKVVIYDGRPEAVQAAICRRYDAFTGKACILGRTEHNYGNRRVISLGSLQHPEEAAAALFAALRELDEEGIELALCEAVDQQGIGLAVMNRMGRAAAFDIERCL